MDTKRTLDVIASLRNELKEFDAHISCCSICLPTEASLCPEAQTIVTTWAHRVDEKLSEPPQITPHGCLGC